MLSLMATFVIPLLRERAHKGLFGKPQLEFMDVLQIGAFNFESGALIGRALRDKQAVLEKVIGHPKEEGAVISFIIEAAERRRRMFPDETSMAMLVLKSDLADLGLSYDELLIDQRVRKTLKTKIPLDDALQRSELTMALGIGFGIRFPDDTEAMYRRTYEDTDPSKSSAWQRFHQAGLAIPEQPTIYPLEERERESLAVLAEYVHEFRTELEPSLGLSHLLT